MDTCCNGQNKASHSDTGPSHLTLKVEQEIEEEDGGHSEAEDEDDATWQELLDKDDPDLQSSIVKCLVGACSWTSQSRVVNGYGDDGRDVVDDDEDIAMMHFTSFLRHIVVLHSEWIELFCSQTAFEGLITDQYDWIRFVNYFRLHPSSDWHDIINCPDWVSKSDQLLRPVQPDDYLLSIDIDSIMSAVSAFSKARAKYDDCMIVDKAVGKTKTRRLSHVVKEPGPRSSIEALEAHNRFLVSQLELCRKSLQNTLSLADSLPGQHPANSDRLTGGIDGYFLAYSSVALHAEMIADRVRTDSYRDFIINNGPHLFANKRVLDVGAGSGILSLFASHAGASHVYAIEATPETFASAYETIVTNQMQDRITLINDRVEDVKLPVDKVDVVISEWMGYFLLFESMLDSVLCGAREFLTPLGGRIYPRHYSLELVGVHLSPELRKSTVDFWLDVYGTIMPAFHRSTLQEAHVADVSQWLTEKKAGLLTSQGAQVLDLDLLTLHREGHESRDLQCIVSQKFSLIIDGIEGEETTLDAIVGYFNVRFDDDAPVKVEFSTSPCCESTHWKQTVFYLSQPIAVVKGQLVTGSISTRRAKDQARALDINIQINDREGDFTAFSNPDFNHKRWINDVLKSAVEHNVEHCASETVARLQLQMKNLMATIDKTCQETLPSLPKLSIDIEKASVETSSLIHELEKLDSALKQVDDSKITADSSSSSLIIDRLASIDRVRRNAQSTANALRETERFASLDQVLHDLIDRVSTSNGDGADDETDSNASRKLELLDQLCCVICQMEECMTVLTHLPNHATRSERVDKARNCLEAVVAPLLMRHLDDGNDTAPDDVGTGDFAEAKHLISLLNRIGRREAANRYYTTWIGNQFKKYFLHQNEFASPYSEPIQPSLNSSFGSHLSQQANSFVNSFIDDSSQINNQVIDDQEEMAEEEERQFLRHCLRLPTIQAFSRSHSLFLALSLRHAKANLFSTPLDTLSSLLASLTSVFVANRQALERLVVDASNNTGRSLLYNQSACLHLTMAYCYLYIDEIKSALDRAENVSVSKQQPDVGCDQLFEGHQLIEQLINALLAPFSNLGSLLVDSVKPELDDLLGQFEKIGQTSPSHLSTIPRQCDGTLEHLLVLIQRALSRCSIASVGGLALPHLTDLIQNYWSSLAREWTKVIDHLAASLDDDGDKAGVNRRHSSPNTDQLEIVLSMVNSTGDLHNYTLQLIDELASRWQRIQEEKIEVGPSHGCLLKSSTPTSMTSILGRLESIISPQDPSGDNSSSSQQLHQHVLTACRSALTGMRRSTLRPVVARLEGVGQLDVWWTPADDDLPDIAYLPQDYITQIGHYLLTLPEQLETYMASCNDQLAKTRPALFSSTTHHYTVSGGGFSACMLAGAGIDSTTVEHRPSRIRLASSSSSNHQLDHQSALTLRWLEQLMAGSNGVCDLLLNALLRLTPPPPEGPERRRATCISESGRKQLIVDLDYFCNLLDELGIGLREGASSTSHANLNAFRLLLDCPESEFASTSSDYASRLVNSVAKLRGF